MQMWYRFENKYIFSCAVWFLFMSGNKCDKMSYTRKKHWVQPGFSLDLSDHVSTLRHVNLYMRTYTKNLTAVQIYSNKTTNKHFLLQFELPSWSEDKHFSSKAEFLPSKAPCHTGPNHQQNKLKAIGIT
jgi:hypothetical protein